LDGKNKASESTNFHKKTDKKIGGAAYVVILVNGAPNFPNRFDKCRQGKRGKIANVVIGDTEMNDDE
jgi:hypothetical protein